MIEDLKLWLLEKDPRNVQYLFDLMYNTTRFPGGAVINAAISGIEHALSDIAGKAAGNRPTVYREDGSIAWQ